MSVINREEDAGNISSSRHAEITDPVFPTHTAYFNGLPRYFKQPN